MTGEPDHLGTLIRKSLRGLLGTDGIQRIEALMATEILTLLQGLAAQTTELTATQQASFVNIHNAINRQSEAITDLTRRLEDALANNGKVTPEMQEAANKVSTALADLKKAAETADDGFEPAEAPTEEPAAPGDETPAAPNSETSFH